MEVKRFVEPKGLQEAYDLLNESNKNQIIAGGAWLKLITKSADTFIGLDKLGLNQIKAGEDRIEIGAMVSLRELQICPDITKLYDGILSDAIGKIMGMNIRNQATIGGSVMGKFAFSDIITPLLAMETKLEFYKAGTVRLEDFLDNNKMGPDILTKIVIKKQKAKGFFKKVARTPLDFAIVNIAVTNHEGKFKIVVGSRPKLASMASTAMEYINSKKNLDDEVLMETAEKAISELDFSDNNRATKEYRKEVAKVYIKRGLKKVIANEN